MSELIRSLQQLPDQLKRDASVIVRATVQTTAEEIAAAYPEGPTGNLRRGVKSVMDADLVGRVRSTARHAQIWERGTVQRFTARTGANRGTMPAGNVFIPSAIRAREAMVHRLIDVVKRAKVDGMTGTLEVRET